MAILFNNYKCSVCKRVKSILKSDTSAFINECTITKGCQGRLLLDSISSTNKSSEVPVSEQWVSRWQTTSTSSVTSSVQSIPLTNSPNGAFVVAVRDHGTLPNSGTLVIEQKKLVSVAFTSFTYTAGNNQLVFSGTDQYSKILRIPQTAIDDGLVEVKINGIVVNLNFCVFTTTSVSLANYPAGVSTGSTVSIVVYEETPTVTSELTLTRNDQQIPSTARGGWSNVSHVYLHGDASTKWILYSVDNLTGLQQGTFKIVSSDLGMNGIILMSNSPHGQRDRIYVSAVEFIDTINEYNLYVANEGSVLRLYAYDTALTTLYPPLMILYGDSFIKVDDTYTTAATLQLDNLSNSSITNPTVLGPI